MFPESFAEEWILRLTKPGDMVMDPFCGRGTTLFQALLLDRSSVGGDINPVAFCLSHAKTNAPPSSAVKRRITWLENRFDPDRYTCQAADLDEFFHAAFSPSTLLQLIHVRENLNWKTTDVDCMVAALVLGALHGDSKRSRRYLSNQMPRTISTKPQYSIRFWKARDLVAPTRNVFEVLREAVEFRYASEPPLKTAQVFCADFRELPKHLFSLRSNVALVLTSPPYLDTTRFEEDQWLRLWFLGSSPYPSYGRLSSDDRHSSESKYWKMIADFWRVIGALVSPGGHVVIRIGGRGLSVDHVRTRLVASTIVSGKEFNLQSLNISTAIRRQTDAFRPGTNSKAEMDFCFRLN